MYSVIYSDKAVKSLKKLNKTVAAQIYGWISKNLNECENPRLHGKALKGDKNGAWRYRVGDYRIIAEIRDKDILILVLDVGHRKEIYKN